MPSPTTTPLPRLDEIVQGLPNICGWEDRLKLLTPSPQPNPQPQPITAAFAIALHMHQPTIPAGANGELISHLQYMFEHPNDGDNHNAAPFATCYRRMADFIPNLISEGCNPRIMLDYSGNLLWGLGQMGRSDILADLKQLTNDPATRNHVEWLGTMWSHAVVPSTPIADIPLHIRAWRHHFASLFGGEALARVRGFSPPEMHLPNDPDTCYAFVKALKDCGYQWVLLQEHTVEEPDGAPLRDPHVPHSLVAVSSRGERASIIALIKTQGSDTKLVGQMQPYYEAKTHPPRTLNGVTFPALVMQISDGENGGVMMNEFPSAYHQAWYEMRDRAGETQPVVGMNGTEYLTHLAGLGLAETEFPVCQPAGQHQLWQRVAPEEVTPERLQVVIKDLKQENPSFSLDGSSWTNEISWVEGYQNVTTPLKELSQLFHTTIQPLHSSSVEGIPLSQQYRYRNALLHLLLLQTSCFRYWGQGAWTDYAQEIYRRGRDILTHDF